MSWSSTRMLPKRDGCNMYEPSERLGLATIYACIKIINAGGETSET